MDSDCLKNCLGCVGVVVLLLIGMFIFNTCRVAGTVLQHRAEIEAMSDKIQAIDRLMEDIKGQGYVVVQTKSMEEDPQNRLQSLIEYEVSTENASQTWTYLWAFRFPAEMYFSDDLDYILSRLDQCELIPLSEPAELVNDQLVQFYESPLNLETTEEQAVEAAEESAE